MRFLPRTPLSVGHAHPRQGVRGGVWLPCVMTGLLIGLLFLSFGLVRAADAPGIPFTVIDSDPSAGNGVLIVASQNHIVRDSSGALYVAYTLRTQQSVHYFNFLRRSTDNGATWSSAVRTESFPDSSSVQSLAIDDNDVLYEGSTFNVGAFFTKSSDQGQTWSSAYALHDGGWGDWDYAPSLVVSDTGVLHAVYYAAYGWQDYPFNLKYRSSQDGGATWSAETSLTNYPTTLPDYGVSYPDLYLGKDGWLFVAYDYFGAPPDYPRKRIFVYYDGQTWSDPVLISTPDVLSHEGDLAVDSNGLVHLIWAERDSGTGQYALRYRTFDPVTRFLSAPRTLSAADENVMNMSMGVYQGNRIVIAYDHYTQSGSTITYGGVYVRSSDDDFASLRKISTHPNARTPNLRSSRAFMNQPTHQDIIWVEPNDVTGGEDLVYADLAGQITPAAGLQVTTFLPKVANPGQNAPILISYRNNMTTTATNAIMVARLPKGLPYLSCTGGGQYKTDEHTVVWKLGNLAPGAADRLVCWINIPWGAPSSTVKVVVKLDADNSPNHVLSLPLYQSFKTNPVSSETYLSVAEIQTLLSNNAGVKNLYDLAISQGYTFTGVGKHITHEQGQQTDVLVFVRRTPFELILLTQSDGNALLIHQNDDTVEFRDMAGGVAIDRHTGLPSSYGQWALPAGGAINSAGWLQEWRPQNPDGSNYEFAADPGICFRNCMATNLAMLPVDTAIDTVMAPFKVGWGALKIGYHVVTWSPADIGKDVLEALPYKNATQRAVEVAACKADCNADPHKYDCGGGSGEVGKKWCDGDVRWYYRCGGARMWQPTPTGFNCTWLGSQYTCENGECVSDVCSISLSATAPSIDLGLEACADGGTNNCNDDSMEIVPAHDPNAKSVQPSGDVLPGELLTYTIEYENTGAGTAFQVFVIDTLDENLDASTLSLGSGGVYNADTRQASWFIGELAPQAGGSVTMTVRVRSDVTSGAIIANQAQVHFPSAGEVTPTDLVVSTVNSTAAEPQNLAVVGHQPLPITLAGREATGAPLTYTVQIGPRYGQLSGVAPNLVYQAMDGFSGLDTFTFIVSHGQASSAPAQVSIHVQPDPLDHTPPVVTGTYPPMNATDIPVQDTALSESPPSYAPILQVTFSEPMTSTSLTGAIAMSNGITGVIKYDDMARTATFAPAQALQAATTYTVTVNSSVQDKMGNPMVTPYIWQFTTASTYHIRATLPNLAERLVFPTLSAGASSDPAVVQIVNDGQGVVAINGINTSGSAAGDFSVNNDTCSGQTLAVQQRCTVLVQFAPKGVGQRNAQLAVTYTGDVQKVLSIPLTGQTPTLYLPTVER